MSLTTQDVWNAIGEFDIRSPRLRQPELRAANRQCLLRDGREVATDDLGGRLVEGAPHRTQPQCLDDYHRAQAHPFPSFIKIPAATITFKGDAEILAVADVDNSVVARLFRGLELDRKVVEYTRIIRLVPRGALITYGMPP